MQTGTVVTLKTGFGFIRPDTGGKDVHFRATAVADGFERLRAGERVEFETTDGPRGLQAVRVFRLAGTGTPAPGAPPAAAPRAPASTTHFLNPYNFVGPLEAKPVPGAGPDTILLGRAEPPPRDRYVGLSGTITCRLATGGPVFVSDSYAVQGRADEHRSFRFFRDGDGVPAIPGSTLRGMVRSVFEAVTNSCWELVSPRTLSRRVQTSVAASLVPGRLVKDGGEWRLEVLDGDTVPVPGGPVREGEPLYAAWVPRYDREGRPVAPRLSRADRSDPEEPQGYQERGYPAIPGSLRHGDPCFARIRLTHHDGQNDFLFFNVEAIGRDDASVREGSQEGDRVVRGYYCATGFNINRKHDERVFFTTRPAPETLLLDRRHVRDYVALLEDYRELHRHEVGTARKDRTQPSRFVALAQPSREEECVGELVYAWLDLLPDGTVRAVKALAPVSVPRLFYDHSIRDRFPALDAVTPCTLHNRTRTGAAHLCPACRVFGWVAREEGEEDGPTPTEGRPVASRSRVRFGPARFPGPDALDSTPRALDILSSPKPTTVRFYLRPQDPAAMRPERPGGRVNNTDFDYDRSRMVVRGRKFYRRHRTVELHPPEKPSAQNRTLREWLPEGREAEFEVSFECLAPVELGALLWALEQQPGWVHRLGFGKPLGLGTVKIDVTSLVLHGGDRYGEAEETSAHEPRAHVEPLKQRFKDAMQQRYGQPFGALSNVLDLKAMLGATPPELPVAYPSLNDAAKPESFHWFVVNNGRRYSERAPGRGVWLPLASEDQGLPFDPALP